MPPVSDSILSRLLAVVGVLACIAAAGAIYLTATGADAGPAWALAGACVTGALGLAVPRS